MDSFKGLIRRLITNLNASSLEYMFTGAIAASFYGTPRTTMDVDIVINVSSGEASVLVHALTEARVSPDDKKIKTALTSADRIVTLRDTQTPYTVDLILATEPLEKRAATIDGQPAYIQSPEALILAKLRMIKATPPPERAQKDRDDITAILRNTPVDIDHIRRKAVKEGTLPTLEELLVQISYKKREGRPKTGRRP